MKSKEIWKDIYEYEGIYQVSNLGRIKSLEREIKYIGKNQYGEFVRKQKVKEKIIKQQFDKDGYMQVSLSKNGKVTTKRVHFLVAQAFIPNANNLHIINHKDENKQNNCANNLEFCTIAYNNSYGSRSKTIKQYDSNGNYIKTWKNSVEATKMLGLKNSGNITSCCKKRLHVKTVGGYIWRYANE